MFKDNAITVLPSTDHSSLLFADNSATILVESSDNEGSEMARDKEKLYAALKVSEEKHYSRLTIKVRNEWDFRNTVKKVADSKGESVNGFMIKAIRDAVRREGGSFPAPVLESESSGLEDDAN